MNRRAVERIIHSELRWQGGETLIFRTSDFVLWFDVSMGGCLSCYEVNRLFASEFRACRAINEQHLHQDLRWGYHSQRKSLELESCGERWGVDLNHNVVLSGDKSFTHFDSPSCLILTGFNTAMLVSF